jgi:hypothetical protein
MTKWSKSAFFVPRSTLMAPMQFRVELFRRAVTPHRWLNSRPESPDGNVSRTGLRATPKSSRDKASPLVGVMLHLRFCYVSKAAILTVPVQPVSVENRSPA